MIEPKNSTTYQAISRICYILTATAIIIVAVAGPKHMSGVAGAGIILVILQLPLFLARNIINEAFNNRKK